MGVIRKACNRAPVISFSDESINSLGISQPSTPPPEPQPAAEEAPAPYVPQRRDPAQLLQRLEQHHRNRHAGARRSRRASNVRALQTLVEDEMEDALEPTIADFLPKADNAFTKLLTDCNNMRIWQHFITRSEQEQREYLESVAPKTQEKVGRSNVGGFSFTQINSETMEENLPNAEGFTVVPQMSDCRHVHPAYSEAHRFSMMEAQLQSLLKKKHLPLGVLSYLEEEIVEIFGHDPLAIYITSELSSFERLLLHALCQYNFLRSKSTTIAGVRRTKVENAHKCFHVPEISLTSYIDKFYRS